MYDLCNRERFYHFSNEAVAVEFVSKLKDKYTEWHPHRYYVYDESHGNASYSTMCPSHGRYRTVIEPDIKKVVLDRYGRLKPTIPYFFELQPDQRPIVFDTAMDAMAVEGDPDGETFCPGPGYLEGQVC